MEIKRKKISRYKNKSTKMLFKKMKMKKMSKIKMFNNCNLRVHSGMNIQLILKENRF